ncbi:MAG: general secretion pathway protein GspK [Verrucomicrobia bacterium]|nr:general secretion pathway protein GspK [Verrucomicrobiota bacterium]
MNVKLNRQPRGIALVIVMIVILVLGILAGGFAYSMKVETKLARNTSFESDLEWLGRSGVEFARYVLAQHMTVVNEPWDSLNQKWAGGPMGTNEVLEAISLENNELGSGFFSIKIEDLERKFNINTINERNIPVFYQALTLLGVSPGDISVITDSLLDWMDPDDDPRLSGSESDDYASIPNPGYAPYLAKNGPIDDLAELLLIRGVNPELYWGSAGGSRLQQTLVGRSSPTFGYSSPVTAGGLVDVFTSVSAGAINLNTASPQVLQLVPGLDPALAQAIVTARAGWDGVDGTEDDVPFRTPGELINVPGMLPQFVQQLQGVFQTRSLTFEVTVDAKINQYRRQFVALLRRNPGNMRDIQTLYFHWK